MIPFEKIYQSVPDNLRVLEERGLRIDDKDHAQKCLSRIGYYRLSAYWYPFRQFADHTDSTKRLDEFRDSASLEDVLKLYLFDKTLRLHLTDALERIEIAVRAQLVDVLGQIGSHAHRDKRSYTSSFTKSVNGDAPLIDPFIAGLDKAFQHSKEEFAKHFKAKYEGDPPVWIAAGTWDWGNLSYMLGYLSDKNRDAICNAIDPSLTRKSLASWMKCLNEVRNACAHHSRLWNKPLINSPRLNPTEIPIFHSLLDERGRVPDAHAKRLYGAIVVMIFLMRTFYPKTQWHLRLRDVILESDLPHEVNVASAGFADGWHEADLWNGAS